MSEFLGYPGYSVDKTWLLSMSKKERDNYCENCYDGSSFPAYLCKKCPLSKYPKNHVSCVECEYYTFGFFMGDCSKTGGHPAIGWGCTEGKVRPLESTARSET